MRYSQICAVPKICFGVYMITSMFQLILFVINKNNQTIWRWRQPCLEPCASVLHPYCTVNKLGLWERSGRRDSKAAEIGRPWGTEGPEGADHPSVVVWPPGVPDGDQNHPHDPAVSRTETLSGTPHTHAFGTQESGSCAEEEGRSKILLGDSLMWHHLCHRSGRPSAWLYFGC